MSRLVVKGLSVERAGVFVLRDVSLEANDGEFIVIVGASGSGKTTFLHALAGFIPANGEKVVPGRIGVVFQRDAVFPWFTVFQNIAFALEGGDRDIRWQLIREHLRLAELEDKGDVYPAQLSGGQIQRVALARALIHTPEILFMDEPYGALDAYTRGKMREWLLQVWMVHRTTVIFVTHDIEEAIFLADRVCVLRDGTLAEEFTIPFPRPRQEDVTFTPEFNALKKNIFEAIRSSA